MALKKFLKGAIADAIDRASSTIQDSLNEISSNLRDDDGQNIADLTDDNIHFNNVKTVVIGEYDDDDDDNDENYDENYNDYYEVHMCTDEYGVKYSDDYKILIEGKEDIESYCVNPTTEIIGMGAFHYSVLKRIELPSSLLKIDRSAFRGCKLLNSIEIPISVEHIGKKAFMDCSSLKSITIPYYVDVIKDYAFNGCTSLESITIENPDITLGKNLFNNCPSIKQIILPFIAFKRLKEELPSELHQFLVEDDLF